MLTTLLMGTHVDLVLHCGGKWRNEDEIVYEGGKVEIVRPVDVDYNFFFTLLDFFFCI